MAIGAGATIIGVNNRNLRTLSVDLGTSEALISAMPAGAVAVSESGLKTADDLTRLRGLGYGAFLIGERFMTEPDPGAALAQLLAVAEARRRATAPPRVDAERRPGRQRSELHMMVKICGITRAEDAAAAVALGASALGFVFWPGSPRAIDPHRARAIAAHVAALCDDGWGLRESAGQLHQQRLESGRPGRRPVARRRRSGVCRRREASGAEGGQPARRYRVDGPLVCRGRCCSSTRTIRCVEAAPARPLTGVWRRHWRGVGPSSWPAA